MSKKSHINKRSTGLNQRKTRGTGIEVAQKLQERKTKCRV